VPNFFCALVIYSFTGSSKKKLSKMSLKATPPHGFGLGGMIQNPAHRLCDCFGVERIYQQAAP
jgi:hypothetical protein